MFRMYSTWTGETLRRTAKLRSSGRPVSGLRAGTIGTGGSWRRGSAAAG